MPVLKRLDGVRVGGIFLFVSPAKFSCSSNRGLIEQRSVPLAVVREMKK